MRYFGKKSLSSVASGILHAAWFAIIVFSIIAFAAGVFIIFFPTQFEQFITNNFSRLNPDFNHNDWEKFKNYPLALKIIIIPYFAVFVVLLLQIIKKSQALFDNFKNDIIFSKSNAVIISKISKLNIGFSLLTFNLSSLLASVLLFILCEIFKKGSALQEEHDLTV